jgi:hypothetical protein
MTLAALPPMGWNSWNYGLNERDRADFSRLTEKSILAQAQAMVDNGMLAAGYNYLVLDDGYQNARRNYKGELQGHALRFREGIPALIQEVKALGLKFGIYSVPGTLTCAQQYDDYIADGLGSLGFETIDANSFAEWGVDYLKYDWCRAHLNDGLNPEDAFRKMSEALKATGKDIVYSISEYGLFRSHEWAPEFTNMWRTTDDLFARWDSVMYTLDLQRDLYPYSKPGAWNDPDMLQVGNGNLSFTENRAHFYLWAVLNAPLMAGNDLLKMSDETLSILIHPGVIAVDQDWSGEQGRLIFDNNDAQVWSKKMADGSRASVFLARGSTAETFELSEVLGEIGGAKDVWTGDSVDVAERLVVAPHSAELIITN